MLSGTKIADQLRKTSSGHATRIFEKKKKKKKEPRKFAIHAVIVLFLEKPYLYEPHVA